MSHSSDQVITRGAKVPDWTTQKLLDHGYLVLRDALPHWSLNEDKSQLGIGDKRIVEAARISMAHLPADVCKHLGITFSQEDRTELQDIKLINYLVKNRHTSPLEKVRFEFIAKMPIFVARQAIRHRMTSVNEVSARYSVLPNEFYVPAPERMQEQSSSNKQASGEQMDDVRAERLRRTIITSSENAYHDYESLLSGGLARELARMVLPTNFYTSWYWTWDLHNLLHFIGLRDHAHAQYEIRVYAKAMLEMAKQIAPVTVRAWEHWREEDNEKNNVSHFRAKAAAAEGKLAALIEWGLKKQGAQRMIKPEELLNSIESMLELDREQP